jgi:hypothetical protein
MNFKSVTINLLLTTLSGGVLLQTLEAQAASITFGAWNFNPATVTTSSSFATGNGNATPMTLKALAEATSTANPLSWGSESARTIVSLSNFFTVTPETGEKNGDKVKGILSGRLEGVMGASGQGVSQVDLFWENYGLASVDVAGFESWRGGEGQVGFGFDPSYQGGTPVVNVNQAFNREGILTIGEQYAFNMSLEVTASKTAGVYQTFSNFIDDGRGLTVNIRAEPVPEPLTILGSATGLGFAAFFKRKHSKKPKKS